VRKSVAKELSVRLLGTGGAANADRRQACLFLTWGDDAHGGRVLLDTGNGMDVVRQILASGFAPDGVRDIFVSHQHMDHVGGLEPLLLWSVIRSLETRGRAPTEPTRVYAEPRVIRGIRGLFEAIASAAPRLMGDSLQLVPVTDGATLPLRGGARLTAFLVDHQPVDGGAMGCIVELDGRRLAYSGDTRPVHRLIEAAQGADVLIHEAGGLDEHGAETHRQGHSTAGDVGRVAKAAGVGRLVLTHMPTEALATSMLGEAADSFGRPVELANDHGELRL
jgi:ribonuclease BN (tRNA processing enzyme)